MHTHTTMKRRRLRTDAVVPGSGGSDATISGESSNTSNTLNYSQLVVVGYTDRGIPLYDKKCLSNDNIRPYSDSCTDTTAAEDAKSDENDRDVGEGGNNNGSSSAAAAAAYYKYECISDRSCNTYDPGNNLDLGWTFIGICQYNSNCPDAYNTSTNSSTYYSTGDVVSVSSDYLNNNIIGSISCPTTDHGSSNSTMVDSSSMSMQSQNDSTSIIVPYLYEVETTQVISADIFLPRLEEQILLNLADSLMSCLDGDDSAANDVNSKYDIQGIDSSPDDVAINEGPCSITSAEADNCFIINGSITLLLATAPTVSNRQRKVVTDSVTIAAATNAAQSYIQTSMEENDLLSPMIPEVIKVKYLHDSYNEYFLGEASSSSLPQSGSNGSEDDRGYLDIILGSVFGVLLLLLLLVLCICRRHQRAKTKAKNGLNLMDDASDVHDTGCGSILMTSLGSMGAAICGILLCKSCNNETKKNGLNSRNDGKNNSSNGNEHDSPGATEADDGLDDIIDQIDCVTDVNDRRIYVIDPPGAFHLGNHHYTGDGVRYFSPLCAVCISARANADGVVTVNAANMADDDSDDDNMSSIERVNNGLNNGLSFDLDAASKFTDFNSNDLGRYHSSMHVRTCKSTTCPICIKKRGVIFVKARGASAASVGFR